MSFCVFCTQGRSAHRQWSVQFFRFHVETTQFSSVFILLFLGRSTIHKRFLLLWLWRINKTRQDVLYYSTVSTYFLCIIRFVAVMCTALGIFLRRILFDSTQCFLDLQVKNQCCMDGCWNWWYYAQQVSRCNDVVRQIGWKCCSYNLTFTSYTVTTTSLDRHIAVLIHYILPCIIWWRLRLINTYRVRMVLQSLWVWLSFYRGLKIFLLQN